MNFNFDEPSLIFNLGEVLSTQRQVAQPSVNNNETPLAKRPSTKGLTMLPPDFEPTNYSVILGRGKGSYNYVGNKRCRVIVKTFLQDFYQRETRSDRAIVVSKVINIIKEACPIGSFIKMENGMWHQVSDKVAREKIFTMFRDVQNAESREALRATSSSPQKLRATSLPAKTSNTEKKRATSIPVRQQNALRDLFAPIVLDDEEDSLGGSLGSKNFYDIESCSLCTI